MTRKLITLLLSIIIICASFVSAFAGAGDPPAWILEQLGNEGSIARIEITEDTNEISSGTYYVAAGKSVKVNKPITISGDVTIDIEDNAVLSSDESLNYTIYVKEGASLLLTGTDTSKILGNVFSFGGTINFYSGNIDGKGTTGYCIDLEENAVLNMYGGTLQNNTLGVNVSNSKMTLNAGSISRCDIGVNAYNGEVFLLGGSITNNKQGIFQSSSYIVLGGSINIIDNKELNLELDTEDVFVISEEVPPTEGMKVGIGYGMFAPFDGEEFILETVTPEIMGYFNADDKNCYIYNDDGIVKYTTRIATDVSDWGFEFRLSENGLEGKTVEYKWYGFDEIEVEDKEEYITISTTTDERYANTKRSYNKGSKSYTIENVIDDEAFYLDRDNAEDLILHVPSNTYITLHGVLKELVNQYEIGFIGEDFNNAYSSYENMGVDLEGFTEHGGDVKVYTMYYQDYDVSIENQEAPSMSISHITFWTLNDKVVGEGSSLDTSNLPEGYYMCKATVKDGDKVVETYNSSVAYNGNKASYENEDLQIINTINSSSFGILSIALIAGAILILVIIIIVVIKKK